MDRIALETLRGEMLDDARVIAEACDLALDRFDRAEPMGYEACAHHVCRLYNAVKQTCLRVAKVFENHIDDETGWHTGLLNRLSIKIAGVRPALLPSDLKTDLHELRGFRHVVVHAYELEFDPDKLRLVLKYARHVRDRWTSIVNGFVERVAQQEALGD